jgi:hypothetical protein
MFLVSCGDIPLDPAAELSSDADSAATRTALNGDEVLGGTSSRVGKKQEHPACACCDLLTLFV